MPADQSVVTDFRAARKAIENEDSTQLAIILKRPNAGTIVSRQIANPDGAYSPDVSLLTSVCDHKYCVPFCGMEMLKTVISAVYKAGGCELFQELSSDGRVFQCFCCNITIPRETALPALYQILEEIGGTGKGSDGFQMIEDLLVGNEDDSENAIINMFQTNGRFSVAPIKCTVDTLQRIGGKNSVRNIMFGQAGFKADLPFTACARYCKADTIRYCVDTIIKVATPEYIRNEILDKYWAESAIMAHVQDNPHLCVESLQALFELVSAVNGNSSDFLRNNFGPNIFDQLDFRISYYKNITTPPDAVRFLCEKLAKMRLFDKFFFSPVVKNKKKNGCIVSEKHWLHCFSKTLVALVQASGVTVVKAATATPTKTNKKQPAKKKAAPASASKKKAKKAAPKKTATKKKAVTAAGKKKKTPVKKQKKVVAKKSKAVTKKKPIQKKK